jgi:hypothetical protein
MTASRSSRRTHISTQGPLSANHTSNRGHVVHTRHIDSPNTKQPPCDLPAATRPPARPKRLSACSTDPTRRPRGASLTPSCAPRRVQFDRAHDRRQAPRTKRARPSRRSSLRHHPSNTTHERRVLRDDADAAFDAADGACPALKVPNHGAHRVVHRQVPVGEGGDSHIRSGAGHSMAAAPERRDRTARRRTSSREAMDTHSERHVAGWSSAHR